MWLVVKTKKCINYLKAVVGKKNVYMPGCWLDLENCWSFLVFPIIADALLGRDPLWPAKYSFDFARYRLSMTKRCEQWRYTGYTIVTVVCNNILTSPFSWSYMYSKHLSMAKLPVKHIVSLGLLCVLLTHQVLCRFCCRSPLVMAYSWTVSCSHVYPHCVSYKLWLYERYSTFYHCTPISWKRKRKYVLVN